MGGTDVDFGAFYGAGDAVQAPKTVFKQVDHWTPARPSSSRASLLGSRVRLPGGEVAFSTAADQIFSPHQLIESAAAEVSPNARVVATEEHGYLPADGEVTTIVASSLGGVSIKVFDGATLLAEGFASTIDRAPVQGVMERPLDDEPSVDNASEEDTETDAVRWDPNSGESVADRLRDIVSESRATTPRTCPTSCR